MKILTSLLFLLFLTTSVFAQNDSIKSDTTYWSKGAVLNLNFSQVDLTNWNGGGKSSISIAGLTNFKLNYQKDKDAWDNRLDMAYGVLRQGDSKQPFIKTDDNIILSSKYSRQLKKRIFVSGMLDFRTQFDEGLDDEGEVV